MGSPQRFRLFFTNSPFAASERTNGQRYNVNSQRESTSPPLSLMIQSIEREIKRRRRVRQGANETVPPSPNPLTVSSVTLPMLCNATHRLGDASTAASFHVSR